MSEISRGNVRVVHIKDSMKDPSYMPIYIGRTYSRPRSKGFGNSPMYNFGNPFKRDPSNPEFDPIEAFRNMIMDKGRFGLDYRIAMHEIANNVAKGDDIELVCFCKPKPCHGDVIKEVIDMYADKIIKERVTEIDINTADEDIFG